MIKWIGNSGEIKTTAEKDLTGTSFNERCKTNTRNLDDLINYFEYAKNSGYPAARVDVEQEEYWSTLLRHLLMEKVINDLVPLYAEGKIFGIAFGCSHCGYDCIAEFRVRNEITQHCNCGITKLRENDIIEYLTYIINKWR